MKKGVYEEQIMKKKMTLQDKAEAAMKDAVQEVVENHKKSGRPMSIWKNGKVLRVSAAKAMRLAH
jgi:hypothetical protein